MQSAERVVIKTPHARAWGTGMFGSMLIASFMGAVDPELPGVRPNPVGLLICVALVILLVRTFRLGIVVTRDRVLVRGYLWTRRVTPSSITSISIVDWLGPWWLNGDKVKALQIDRHGRGPVRVWGVTGRQPRIKAAKRKLAAALEGRCRRSC
jgi:hypothetical protein